MENRLTVLYLEGFSPGPGLPSPLLTQCGFRVLKPRMPYECFDILANPYVYFLALTGITTVWILSLIADSADVAEGPEWVHVVLVVVAGLLACWRLKREAVGYTLDKCVNVFAKEAAERSPDLVIGYSWGGGVACGLLNRGLWAGPTLLLAPAGDQMWSHAGRALPSLRPADIPPGAAVLTVQGTADVVVSHLEAQRLHEGADPRQCRLLVANSEDHFLRYTVAPAALTAWAQELIKKHRDATNQR